MVWTSSLESDSSHSCISSSFDFLNVIMYHLVCSFTKSSSYNIVENKQELMGFIKNHNKTG